nr:CDP-diacylglycerol--glycerol-3-phosphate 3-phosphatidyltransferase [candidate division Zixibacteria bacterium]
MNMPNKLTLSRIILTPVFMSFFLIDNAYSRIFGFILYVVAALTDIADGHYARKYGIITGFGKFMDPLADKILVSAALIALVSLGFARAWMVMLIIAREFYVTGIRSLAAYKGSIIPASTLAKLKTIIQMSTITFMLLVITLDAFFSLVESPLKELLIFNRQEVYDILLGAATLITVYTGFDYTVKYYSMLKNVLR